MPSQTRCAAIIWQLCPHMDHGACLATLLCNLQLTARSVHISNWTHGQVKIADVLVTCASSSNATECGSHQSCTVADAVGAERDAMRDGVAGGGGSGAGASQLAGPGPPCTLHDVYNGEQLNVLYGRLEDEPAADCGGAASNAPNGSSSMVAADIYGNQSDPWVSSNASCGTAWPSPPGTPRVLLLQRSFTVVLPTALGLATDDRTLVPQLQPAHNTTLMSAGGPADRVVLDLADFANTFVVDEGARWPVHAANKFVHEQASSRGQHV